VESSGYIFLFFYIDAFNRFFLKNLCIFLNYFCVRVFSRKEIISPATSMPVACINHSNSGERFTSKIYGLFVSLWIITSTHATCNHKILADCNAISQTSCDISIFFALHHNAILFLNSHACAVLLIDHTILSHTINTLMSQSLGMNSWNKNLSSVCSFLSISNSSSFVVK
jgi:hypothetical protein